MFTNRKTRLILNLNLTALFVLYTFQMGECACRSLIILKQLKVYENEMSKL